MDALEEIDAWHEALRVEGERLADKGLRWARALRGDHRPFRPSMREERWWSFKCASPIFFVLYHGYDPYEEFHKISDFVTRSKSEQAVSGFLIELYREIESC